MLSKRLNADKLIFSPKNSDSFRLQQLYQSIRNLEALLAEKRRALGVQRNCRFASRLLGHRQSKTAQLVSKLPRPLNAARSASFNRSSSNLCANAERFTNTILKSMDSRPMAIEMLNTPTRRIAPRFLFDHARCEAFTAPSSSMGTLAEIEKSVLRFSAEE